VNKRSESFYFDTAALWKFYREEKGSLNIRRLVSKVSQPIILSPLTIIEFISVLMKCYRKGYFKKKGLRKVVKRLRRDAGPLSQTRPFAVLGFPQGSFKRAESILLEYANQNKINANDSLHLAVVLNLQSIFPNITIITSDHAMKNVCEKTNIPSYDPEEVKP